MASDEEYQRVSPAKIIQQELLTFISDSKQTKDQCPRILIFPDSLGPILLKNIRYQAAMYGLASVYIYVDTIRILVVCHENDLRELYIEDFEEEDSEPIDISLLQKHSIFYAAVQEKLEQKAPILSYESAKDLSEPNKDKQHTPEALLEYQEIQKNLDFDQLPDRTPIKEQPTVVTSIQLKPDSMIVNFDMDEFIVEDLTSPSVQKQGNKENSNITPDASSEYSSNETGDALSNWTKIKTVLLENSPVVYNTPITFLTDLENIYKEKLDKLQLIANSIRQVKLKEALLVEPYLKQLKAKTMADANEGSIIANVQHDIYAEEEEDTDKGVKLLEKEIGQGDACTGLTALSGISKPKTDQTCRDTKKSKIIYQETGHGDNGDIPMQETCTEEKTVKSTPGDINSN